MRSFRLDIQVKKKCLSKPSIFGIYQKKTITTMTHYDLEIMGFTKVNKFLEDLQQKRIGIRIGKYA